VEASAKVLKALEELRAGRAWLRGTLLRWAGWRSVPDQRDHYTTLV